jgi:CRP-like cAMP-binding protein
MLTYCNIGVLILICPGWRTMRKKTAEIIAEVPLFNGLPDDQLDKIAAIAIPKTAEKGGAIFSDGDVANGFYVVAEGSVKIYKMSMDGKEKILHIFGPAEPFGEVPVFAGTRFPASAQAVIKSQLLFFPREAFVRLITDTPSLCLNMLAVLSERLRQFAAQIENLSLKEVPSRLASYLLSLSKEQKGRDAVTLPISKGQIAGLLGTIPETLSRIFARMAQQELIAVDGRRIRLLDRDGIETLVENGKLLE